MTQDELASAAKGGALRVLVPLVVTITPVLFLGESLITQTFRSLMAMGVPFTVSQLGLNFIGFMLALGAGELLVRWLNRYIEPLALRSRDLGRAAVAGICLGLTGVGLAALVASGVIEGHFLFLETGFRLLAVALGIGYLGGKGFTTVASIRGEPVQLPTLYHCAQGAGVSVVAGLGLGTGWALAAWALPWISAPSLLSLLAIFGTSWAASVGLAVAALSPATYLAGRWLRRRSPGGSRLALGIGLVSTGTIMTAYALINVLVVDRYAYVIARPLEALPLLLLAFLAQLLAAWWGVGPEQSSGGSLHPGIGMSDAGNLLQAPSEGNPSLPSALLASEEEGSSPS